MLVVNLLQPVQELWTVFVLELAGGSCLGLLCGIKRLHHVGDSRLCPPTAEVLGSRNVSSDWGGDPHLKIAFFMCLSELAFIFHRAFEQISVQW